MTPHPPAAGDARLDELRDRVEAHEHRLRMLETVGRSAVTDVPLSVTPPVLTWPVRVRLTDQADPAPEALRAAVEAISEAVVGLDAGGLVRVWNPKAARVFGWSAAEAVGGPPPYVADADGHAELLRRARGEGQVRGEVVVCARKDGRRVTARVTVVPTQAGGAVLTFHAAAGYPGEVRPADATTARLATLGRVLAGVAHDFNNLLAVVRGHAELLAEELPAGSRGRESVEAIAATTEVAADLTKRLVAAARPDPEAVVETDVAGHVRQLARVLRVVVGGAVKLGLVVSSEAGSAVVPPAEFTQVLLNLVTNARDAMPGGGSLTVRVAAQAVGPGRAGWPDDVPPGEFVVLTVGDTGTGMDEATREHVFEEFFTTRPDDGGHGIGLSTVRDIVARCGGHVEVESAPGWGTQVRVYFRRA